MQKNKSKISIKHVVLFAVNGCSCLALAWWATYAAEQVAAEKYSDAFVVFFLTVFFMLAGTMLYKIAASFCLGVCFMFCLLVICYGVFFIVRYVRTKKASVTVLGAEEGVSRTAFVLCIISVIVTVAAIALGLWFAVRLSMI